jgi:uracil-DNA glycosylase family 4
MRGKVMEACDVKGRVGGTSPRSLEELNATIAACRRCPRLVRYREEVARVKVARFREWSYWGRPVPGFGDPEAQLLVVGLAPAAHGGNRTGRVFTGDRSGDWLFRALHRAGFANQPTSRSIDDGLRLRNAYIAAALRCAPPGNRPTPAEFARCQPFLESEIRLLGNLRVVIGLGRTAMDRFLRAWAATGHQVPRPHPRFGHAVAHDLGGITLIASYHPSQRNTQTGLLRQEMFDRVFRLAKTALEERRTGAVPEARTKGRD